MPANSSMRWKVRANPSRARRYTGSRVMSLPPSSTRPASGRSSPSRQLKNVVLPAPFGPMRPTASPSSTVIETSSSAVMPENRFVIPRASSKLMLPALGPAARAARATLRSSIGRSRAVPPLRS